LLASCQTTEQTSQDADPVIADALSQVNIDSVKVYIDDLVALHTRHTLSSQTDPQQGIGAAVEYLASRCERWSMNVSPQRPSPIVERVYYAAGGNGGRYDRQLQVPELMVTIPGTIAEREIILMAHIDTRVQDVMDSTTFAPGADDDGSGLACLLETVRILSQIPLEQTVKCLFVSGEEQGLDGSRHFASRAREEGWPIKAVLNNDMIGNTRASGTELREDHKVRIFSESVRGEDSDSRQLARYIKEIAGTYVPDQEVVLNYRKDRYRRGGDHSNFLAEGFTAVRVCEYCEDYERTHQVVRTEDGVKYGDIQEYVDFPYLVRNIRVNLAAVMNLAMAPDAPVNVRISNAAELDNNTRVSWTPLDDQDVSYQLLFRETDKSEWQIADAGNPAVCLDGQLEFTCPLSKDNYYFAVRAVSAAGHPGLPAVAR
jgi:Predicted aminopeptidases